MKLSLITINRNNVAGLEKTLQSVADQTFKEFEYIVIDGASTDGSVEVIKKYEFCFAHLKWVSESDSGIYNAMNKGLRMASGEYIQILNSGDGLAAPDVTEKMLDELEKAGGYQDWYYAEDWYLWIRMYLSGAKFYNIQENLVNIRMNYDSYERRSGLKYYKSIKGLLKFMKQNKVIGYFAYTKEKFKRFIGHVLVPKRLKSRLYRKYLRRK